MRMRKKRNGEERLKKCTDIIVSSRDDLPGLPVDLEIGCGKGGFIRELAARHPEKNYVAVEKCRDAAVIAAEKIIEDGLENVRMIVGDAKMLPKYFKHGDVESIYLNFSDPWPKSGQHKRRLTYRSFLEIYKSVLCDNGSIIFKTDNRKLFDFSVDEFLFSGFELDGLTYDLHNGPMAEGNIMTEYEKTFSSKGFTINRVRAILTESALTKFRPACRDDIDAIMEMFGDAREYLKNHGVDQWQDGYPETEVIENDIAASRGYVIETCHRPVAYAALCFGEEPTYREIDGAWPDDLPYAALHRMVVSKEHKGMSLAGKMIARFETICSENGITRLRGDTHRDNRSMRRTLEKNGFTECGIILLANGDPRTAYKKTLIKRCE